nr:unnamed protein product [Callosobruchus analis]
MAHLVSAVSDVLEEFIILQLRKKLRKREWMRKWIRHRNTLGTSEALPMELQLEDPKSFCNFLGIDHSMLNELLETVASIIQIQNTTMRNAILAAVKLQVVLRCLGSGDSFLYRIPKNTIRLFLVEVVNAIYFDFKDFLQKKTVWDKIINRFNNKWNFPHCVDAIDGKHITSTIKCPKNSRSLYHNYKNQFSVCIDVGRYGSSSDGGIFANSSLYSAIEENKRPNQILKERIFNYRLCRARRISENAFGILTNRFRILLRAVDLEPEKVTAIVKTCCALHSWIRKSTKSNHGLTDDVENTENDTITLGTWRQQPFPQALLNMALTKDRNFNNSAGQKRANLSDYFMSEDTYQLDVVFEHWDSTLLEENALYLGL